MYDCETLKIECLASGCTVGPTLHPIKDSGPVEIAPWSRKRASGQPCGRKPHVPDWGRRAAPQRFAMWRITQKSFLPVLRIALESLEGMSVKGAQGLTGRVLDGTFTPGPCAPRVSSRAYSRTAFLKYGVTRCISLAAHAGALGMHRGDPGLSSTRSRQPISQCCTLDDACSTNGSQRSLFRKTVSLDARAPSVLLL